MSTPYANLIENIRPLDLVFFRGSDLVSDLISKVQEYKEGNGNFTHVGIIVNKEVLPKVKELKTGLFYILESTCSINILGLPTSDGALDVVTNKGVFGVQIRQFDEVVTKYTSYGGHVALGRLLNNPFREPIVPLTPTLAVSYERRRKDYIFKISQFYERYKTTTYELHFESFLPMAVPKLTFVRTIIEKLRLCFYSCRSVPPNNDVVSQKKYMFCSELVAELMQVLRILPADRRPDEYKPIDFLGYNNVMCISSPPVYIK